jgi:hypothetical protein
MVALLLLLVALFTGALLPSAGPGPVEGPVAAEEEVPAVVLVSNAGEQTGAQGSACVNGPASGFCLETAGPVEPAELSVVRPGEAVKIALDGDFEASGLLVVRPFGCPEEEVASLPLGSPENWAVDLEPGAYALEASYRFEDADAGLHGDTTVALGLLVDRSEPVQIVPVDELLGTRLAGSAIRPCADG